MAVVVVELPMLLATKVVMGEWGQFALFGVQVEHGHQPTQQTYKYPKSRKATNQMKHFLITFALALGSQFVIAEEPKKETTQVCVDVKDKEGKPVKDAKGNVKQNCKEVKQHKKLEGTEIPGKK